MGKITDEDIKEIQSYAEATDPTKQRFCAGCGKECVTGQAMWNGWFMGEGLYHYECAPKDILEGLKNNYGKPKSSRPASWNRGLKKDMPVWAQKYAKDTVGRNGLIDPEGRFYPCLFTGHNDLWDDLRAAGLPETELDSEKKWIKVSCGIFIGLTVFVMHGKRITARQKITVERIVVQEKLFYQEGASSWIEVGYGDVLTFDKTTGHMKWERQDD